jgi:hypothetical protein
MGHDPRATSVITTRNCTVVITHIVVRLVGYGRKLPEKYSGRTSGLVPD